MNKQWFYRVTDPDMPVDFQLAHDFPSRDYRGPFTLFAQATVDANTYVAGLRAGKQQKPQQQDVPTLKAFVPWIS